MPVFGLDVQLRRYRRLREEIVNMLIQAIICPPSVRLIMHPGGAEGKTVVDRGYRSFSAESTVTASEAVDVQLGRIAFEQRSELVEAGHRRAALSKNIEIGFSQAGLDWVDVNVLEELGLKQLADTGYFAPADTLITIGKKSVCGSITRIAFQRYAGLALAEPIKVQILVDAGKADASGSAILIQ